MIGDLKTSSINLAQRVSLSPIRGDDAGKHPNAAVKRLKLESPGRADITKIPQVDLQYET